MLCEKQIQHDEDMLWWAGLPENQHENIDHDVIEKIKNNPKKWLYSLPMFEYAYVLTVLTAMKYGGSLDPYYEDLYLQRMNPILKMWYDRLARYRIRRMIHAGEFASMKASINNTTLTEELAQLRLYGMKCRKALRGAVTKFVDDRCNDTTRQSKTADPETYG